MGLLCLCFLTSKTEWRVVLSHKVGLFYVELWAVPTESVLPCSCSCYRRDAICSVCRVCFHFIGKPDYRFSVFSASHTNVCYSHVCLFVHQVFVEYVLCAGPSARSVFQVRPLRVPSTIGNTRWADSATSARGLACPPGARCDPLGWCSDGVKLAAEPVGHLGSRWHVRTLFACNSLQLIFSTVNKYGHEVYETQTSFRRKKDG